MKHYYFLLITILISCQSNSSAVTSGETRTMEIRDNLWTANGVVTGVFYMYIIKAKNGGVYSTSFVGAADQKSIPVIDFKTSKWVYIKDSPSEMGILLESRQISITDLPDSVSTNTK